MGWRSAENWTAISNAAIKSQSPAGPGQRLTVFSETRPISTYLFAFAAGPFRKVRETPGLPGLYVRQSKFKKAEQEAPEVQQIRIPQQAWADGTPPLGASGLPVAQGVVRWFDLNAGIGMISREGPGDDIFFHFTALPGQGYRTIRPGVPVKFEIVESRVGLTARNVQQIKEPG